MLPATFVSGQAISSLSAREAHDAAQAGTLVLLDIRTPEEWRDTGLPKGAIALDAETPGFEVRLAGLRLDHRGKRIALIDRSGGLSSSLRDKLAGRGWREIVAVRGGMLGPGGWLAEGLPVVAYP
ncbi:rhodanese-like domain-containing protein [Bosea sp. (in: a-proteobacteria)]|uniref:rhodanese-like domain-containing protein n=1 Tax=Bosea sp. (in: a-proteobacteria) TaxID=1871050 RepID=UPI0035645F1C